MRSRVERTAAGAGLRAARQPQSLYPSVAVFARPVKPKVPAPAIFAGLAPAAGLDTMLVYGPIMPARPTQPMVRTIMADEAKTPDQAAPNVQQFPTDYSTLSTIYTNFCRVNVTPEELVLDFGLSTQLTPNPSEPVRMTHRIVMNFYTAKRLMMALHNVVQKHENEYGVLELDFTRRARTPSGIRPGAPQIQGQPPRPGPHG